MGQIDSSTKDVICSRLMDMPWQLQYNNAGCHSWWGCISRTTHHWVRRLQLLYSLQHSLTTRGSCWFGCGNVTCLTSLLRNGDRNVRKQMSNFSSVRQISSPINHKDYIINRAILPMPVMLIKAAAAILTAAITQHHTWVGIGLWDCNMYVQFVEE